MKWMVSNNRPMFRQRLALTWYFVEYASAHVLYLKLAKLVRWWLNVDWVILLAMEAKSMMLNGEAKITFSKLNAGCYTFSQIRMVMWCVVKLEEWRWTPIATLGLMVETWTNKDQEEEKQRTNIAVNSIKMLYASSVNRSRKTSGAFDKPKHLWISYTIVESTNNRYPIFGIQQQH